MCNMHTVKPRYGVSPRTLKKVHYNECIQSNEPFTLLPIPTLIGRSMNAAMTPMPILHINSSFWDIKLTFPFDEV